MLGKRERFERTDVPRPNPLRPFIAIGVLVAVALLCVVLTRNAWHKANQLNGLNDGVLDDALYEQLDTTDPTDGYERSEDSFSNTLILIVDDVHAEQPTLLGARIMVRNLTAGTAGVLNIPLNTKLISGERVAYLSGFFSEVGATGVLASLTDAANVHVSHVLVAGESVWEQLHSLKSPTLWSLLSSDTDVYDTMATDFRTSELVEISEWLREIGPDNEFYVDATFMPDTLEDGTEVAVLDRQQIPRDMRIFVVPGAEEAPAGETPAEEVPAEEAPAEGEYSEESEG